MEPLEREDEQLALARLLEQAWNGRGGAVLIEGPAGNGKSRLVEHVRALAKQRGFGRLYGIGDEAEQAMPWGVVRQLVDRYAMRYAGAARALALSGPAERALATLDAAPEGSDPRDAAALARTLHALWWLTVDLAAARPMLIAVDDAQWSDASSLRFLTYLTRRMADLPVALVVATRPPTGPGGPLVELTAGRIGVRLMPRPLTGAAIGELAVRRGESARPEVVAAVEQASGGNPLLAGQLFDELATRSLRLDSAGTAQAIPRLGPPSVSRSLLAGLSGSASALAAAAAVLGGHCDMG
ncbi:MAG: ATP-binding protein, partial [Actinomycetota bacterium]|nr:ATP-binding protein [Actinomycetota bacterium]